MRQDNVVAHNGQDTADMLQNKRQRADFPLSENGHFPWIRVAELRSARHSNAVLIWNTVQMTRITAQLRDAGHHVSDEDLARVSPLAHAHVIPNGSYFQSPRRRTTPMPEPAMA